MGLCAGDVYRIAPRHYARPASADQTVAAPTAVGAVTTQSPKSTLGARAAAVRCASSIPRGLGVARCVQLASSMRSARTTDAAGRTTRALAAMLKALGIAGCARCIRGAVRCARRVLAAGDTQCGCARAIGRNAHIAHTRKSRSVQSKARARTQAGATERSPLAIRGNTRAVLARQVGLHTTVLR